MTGGRGEADLTQQPTLRTALRLAGPCDPGPLSPLAAGSLGPGGWLSAGKGRTPQLCSLASPPLGTAHPLFFGWADRGSGPRSLLNGTPAVGVRAVTGDAELTGPSRTPRDCRPRAWPSDGSSELLF